MQLGLGFVLLLVAAAACSEGFPAEELRQRVDAHLAAHRDELRETLGHYALVYPVEPAELARFAQRLRVLPGPEGPVLGSAGGAELHGGGVLALLLAQWRPDGRAARLEDGFPFAPGGTPVRLASVYAACRRQLVLPEGGGLPRLHLHLDPRLGFGPVADRDAYAFLGLLLDHEEALDRPWTNDVGQTLTVRALLERVAERQRTRPPLRASPEDHSDLHLVALLLAWSHRDPGVDLEAVQARFLERDLAAPPPERDAAEVLAHYAESLGLLLAEPRLDWTPEQRRRARTWLAGLEDAAAFRDLSAVEVHPLAHLARGLALASQHRARLR